MTAQEAAEKWNVSLRWVQRLCKENRIEGAMNSRKRMATHYTTRKIETQRVIDFYGCSNLDTLSCQRECEVINMAMWNPWRGCHKQSGGCRYCYIHKGDFRRGIDTNKIVKIDNFYAPIAKNKSGAYKIKSGQTVYLCFSADFLVGDADEWRSECCR